MKLAASIVLLIWILTPAANAQTTRPAASPSFVHPGLLHSRADLDRMRQRVGAGQEPWKSGFEKLRADPQSRGDWRLRGPRETVTRQTTDMRGNNEMVADGNAAYQNALMWCITGDEAHAKKSIEILNAWSHTLKKMDGRDVILAAGLNGFKFVNAAELMRYTYPQWKAEDVAQCERMLREVVYPPIENFATFANGNWDAACMKTMMGIGVFCNDRALFDRAIDYYRHGTGDGCLTHYVFNDAGQCQESGRDQAHTQLGLGALADCCQIAWNQGVDLYGEADNRLLKGFEYAARYNLGNDVPFVPHIDTTGQYRQKIISPKTRGTFRPIYEMVYNHYAVLKHIPAPYTKQAAEKIRPEGGGFGSDQPGFGTLLYSLPSN
jgi:hypothetical protein